MKKLIAALFAAGMFAAVLGAAETQVYNANFKKDSVAWSPKKEVIKVQKNTALIVDVIGHAQSIQIGTQVPAGLEAGNYRMDCMITLSQAAKTRVYIIRNVPKWDWMPERLSISKPEPPQKSPFRSPSRQKRITRSVSRQWNSHIFLPIPKSRSAA